MFTDWFNFRGFIYGTWEPSFVSAISESVSPGMTVVDIGAHIGFYTLLLAKAVGRTGRVLAFEPLPRNFELLEQNIRINKLEHVQLFAQAVFSSNGKLALSLADERENSGAASFARPDRPGQLQVNATTIDSVFLASDLRLDFLKIDVEGAECEVLLGARKTILRFHPRMAIELHHFDGDRAQSPVPDLLRDLGYDVQWLARFPLTSHILACPRGNPREMTPA